MILVMHILANTVALPRSYLDTTIDLTNCWVRVAILTFVNQFLHCDTFK